MDNKQDEQECLPELQEAMHQEYGMLSPSAVFAEWREQLIWEINRLIKNDFHLLASSLYRLDVSESKLKYLLDQNRSENAAPIIADLIIERQVEKIKSRRLFSRRDNNISEEDKW